MTVSTCHCGEGKLMVVGTLKDERFQEFHALAGEVLPGGIIHHLTIRLLMNAASLLIEDVSVEMKTVPEEACLETCHCLDALKGLTITKGFTVKAKKLAGGKQGCTHLMELLLVMAPAAFQGRIAYRGRVPINLDAQRIRGVIDVLVDTCHAWREDGPIIKKIKAFLNKKSNRERRASA